MIQAPAPTSTQQAAAQKAPRRRASSAPPRISSNQTRLQQFLQPKLEIGAVNDPLEREADAAADQVMRMSDPAIARSAAQKQVNRKCESCADEDKHLQMKQAGPAHAQPNAPASVLNVLRAGGSRPLDPAAQTFFASRFGRDLSSVRIHDDPQAAASAREVGARAYAVGEHIAFAAGQYAPRTESGQRLLAHELAHVLQQTGGQANQLRRAPPDPTPPATAPPAAAPPAGAKKAPGPCHFNCDDTSFLASTVAERQAQFDQACPDGFPAANTTTFFGQPIPGETGKMLRSKLIQAQSLAMREMCVQGKDPHGYTLDRRLDTRPDHSGGPDKSIDIDIQGQPYVAHEAGKDAARTAAEGEVDRETGPVYNRISFWENGRKSVIPGGITSVTPVQGGSGTQRTWTDPATGAPKTPVTTGEIYDRLDEENVGMRGYFLLLEKNIAQLKAKVTEVLAADPTRAAAFAAHQLPTDASDASVQAFRKRIAEDYLILGGSKAQLTDLTDPAFAKAIKAPPTHGSADRPFQGGGRAYDPAAKQPAGADANRRPELGFLSLPREVVVALTATGLRWGAIDFAGRSGDVMHFDCRGTPGC